VVVLVLRAKALCSNAVLMPTVLIVLDYDCTGYKRHYLLRSGNNWRCVCVRSCVLQWSTVPLVTT